MTAFLGSTSESARLKPSVAEGESPAMSPVIKLIEDGIVTKRVNESKQRETVLF